MCSVSSQSLMRLNHLLMCFWSVFTYRSTLPTDCGCRFMALVLHIPRRSNMSCMRRDSNFRSWSLCSCLRTPKRQKKLVTRTSATVVASWLGMASTSGHLVVHGDQEVSISPLTHREGPWRFSRKVSRRRTGASGPPLLVVEPRRAAHFSVVISQRRFSSVASNSAVCLFECLMYFKVSSRRSCEHVCQQFLHLTAGND
jgi:hypothetical protein